jgi:hypothetical protein
MNPLDQPPQQSSSSLGTAIDILNTRLKFKQKEVEYDIELRTMRLEAKQRIARQKLQQQIAQQFLEAGIHD